LQANHLCGAKSCKYMSQRTELEKSIKYIPDRLYCLAHYSK